MEVCRLLSVLSIRLQKKVEDMKHDVFDIVTTSSGRGSLV